MSTDMSEHITEWPNGDPSNAIYRESIRVFGVEFGFVAYWPYEVAGKTYYQCYAQHDHGRSTTGRDTEAEARAWCEEERDHRVFYYAFPMLEDMAKYTGRTGHVMTLLLTAYTVLHTTTGVEAALARMLINHLLPGSLQFKTDTRDTMYKYEQEHRRTASTPAGRHEVYAHDVPGLDPPYRVVSPLANSDILVDSLSAGEVEILNLHNDLRSFFFTRPTDIAAVGRIKLHLARNLDIGSQDTVAKAAAMNGAKFVGVDKNNDFCSLAERRIDNDSD